jgi:outer membrane protein OmpA-like peptidoglycan-associated protein
MDARFMDSVKGMLTPETLGKASEVAGEPPETTRRAAQGAVPTIFAGLAHVASTPAGASGLFAAFGKGGGGGEHLMSKVFGDRAGAVGDALAQSSGVSGKSASRVLTFLLPLVAGYLGKHIVSHRLDAGGLSGLLLSQKKAILDDPNTPGGLSGALGLRNLSDLGGGTANVAEPYVSSAVVPAPAEMRQRELAYAVPEPHRAVEVRRRESHQVARLVALAVGALLVLAIFAVARRQAPRVGVTEHQPTLPTVPKIAPPNLHRMPEVRGPSVPSAGPLALPGGGKLDVAPDSTTANMAHTLGDPASPLPQTFRFPDLGFDSGSATPTATSTKAVDDVATLLQAYPSSHIRIAGHADSSGDPDANRHLSESRATSIKDMLVARGVAADRIETVGESESAPVAPNESAQGRAQNRRAEIVLLSR